MPIKTEPCIKDKNLSLLFDRIYGRIPENPKHLTVKVEYENEFFAAGRAIYRKQILMPQIDGHILNIPFTSIIPKASQPCPAIIFLSYESGVPNMYLPAEEILDRGYAIFSICIEDLSDSSVDFKEGAFSGLFKSRRKKNSPGKIAIWAYGAEILCDYVASIPETDKSAIIVAGHGVTAKSALLSAAASDKISFVIANDSLSFISSAALDNIEGRMAYDHPHLFCPAFAEEPIKDEHFTLLSLCEDKNILVGCCTDDARSNYRAEFKMLTESKGYTYGLDSPFITDEKIPTATYLVQGDDFSYHLRRGTSYLSREDWNIYLDYIDKKLRNQHI